MFEKSKNTFRCTSVSGRISTAPVLLFESKHLLISALRDITLQAYPFGIICSTSHLELILRENKLTYTKLILNEADSGMKIGIELYKEKKCQMHLFYGRHSSGLCTLHQYYSSSLPIRDYLLYESFYNRR